MNSLVEMEKKAFALKNSGKTKEAADLFAAIVNKQPDWEHGGGCYSLAWCYENLGEFAKADEFFLKALGYDPKNTIFCGGYASFLYLHGDPNRALEWHLKLLSIELACGNETGAKNTKIAIQALRQKLGLSDQAE